MPNSNPPILHIENYHKMEGNIFWDARFYCLRAIENPTLYRFQFEDTDSLSKRFIWVEIFRIADWDPLDKKWIHRLNYPHCPKHIVSAIYLSDFNNAIKTMGMALKPSMNHK